MFSYRPHFLPTNIVVYGGGGTGGRLIPPLAQLVRNSIRRFNPNAWNENIRIFIFDGDVVEEKNIQRQNFIPADVGKNKAQVLASRYSRAYGVEIYGIPEFFSGKMTPEGDTYSIMKMGKVNINGVITKTSSIVCNAIHILAVDSADARRDIIATALGLAAQEPMAARNQFWIDAGNEDDFGQIKTWTPNWFSPGEGSAKGGLTSGLPPLIPAQVTVPYIPFDMEYYLNLGGSAQELSCADLPQTLAINFMMASLIIGTAQNFLQMRPMSYDGQRLTLLGSMLTESCDPRRWSDRAARNSAIYRGAEVYSGLKSYLKTALNAFPPDYIEAPSDVAIQWTKAQQERISNANIYIRLRNAAAAAYKEAGQILDRDGTLMAIKPKVVEKELAPSEPVQSVVPRAKKTKAAPANGSEALLTEAGVPEVEPLSLQPTPAE